jgi:transcriptional regulator with XRE-family HTH domain
VKNNELADLFGRNIKAARAKRRMNQEELCDLANIDRSYLSKIENGNCNATLEKVYKLAQALQCPLVEILPSVGDVKVQ